MTTQDRGPSAGRADTGASRADALAEAEAEAAEAEARAAAARARAARARATAAHPPATDVPPEMPQPIADTAPSRYAGRVTRVAAAVLGAALVLGLLGASAYIIRSHRALQVDRQHVFTLRRCVPGDRGPLGRRQSRVVCGVPA